MCRSGRKHRILNTLSKGRWNDFIVRIRFKADFTGLVEVWHRLEGQAEFAKVFTLSNVPTLQWTRQLWRIHSGYAVPYRDGWVSGNWVQRGSP